VGIGSEQQIQELTTSIEKHTVSATLPQSSDSSGDDKDDSDSQRQGRGRPKKDMSHSPKKLKRIIYDWLVSEMREIQKSIDEDNSLFQNKGASRKRDDKPRTKIIRLVKKIPDKILKTLVSVGDYKHTSPDRLIEAYRVALCGLISLSSMYNLQIDESNGLTSMFDFVILIKFGAIHFPKSKIELMTKSFAMSVANGFNVQVLLKDRDSTSVKKLKMQMENNEIVRLLFSLAFELLKSHTEFQDSLKILSELTQL
jgi:hypothetical protein